MNDTKFNWRDYIKYNIDLQQERIRSENAAIIHYNQYGYLENRITYKEKEKENHTQLSDDYTFVILRCVKKERVSDLWINCYNSIRNFYPNSKIVIIDNNSNYKYIKDIELINVDLIQHNDNPAGEILPFYYFLKYKWSKYMIYFQDSMFLNRPLCANKLKIDKFKFFWHFYPGVHDHRVIIPGQIDKLKDNSEIHKLFKNKKMVWKLWFILYNVFTILRIYRRKTSFYKFNRLY